MAAVITSPAAHRRFVEDAGAFAGDFDLRPSEVEALLVMQQDLTSLTASFVAKRSITVRWNARRTLAMLGPRGTALVDEYVGGHPMVESFREEADRFTAFVVARTRDLVDETFRSIVIAEMARYERLRSLAFWGARATPQPRRPRLQPGHLADAAGGAIGLAPGAQVDSFRWDMRIFHRCRVAPLRLLRDDPCDLLCFHNGRANGQRVQRLRPDELAFVRRVRQSGPVPADAPVEGRRGEVPARDVAAPLLASEAMIWT
jgi:hypothetical protein